MMILMGEDDDWAPVPPCHDLPARYPNAITFVAYPARNHDFDAPGATGERTFPWTSMGRREGLFLYCCFRLKPGSARTLSL